MLCKNDGDRAALLYESLQAVFERIDNSFLVSAEHIQALDFL